MEIHARAAGISGFLRARRLAAISLGGAATVFSSHALAQDTIDANAKPYFIVGGIVATILFAAFGGYFFAQGLRSLRLGAAAHSWPTTPGKVVSAEVVKKIGYSDGKYEYYSPEIRYSYTAKGTSYTGRIIKIGLTEVHYLTEAPAREWLARYPAGAKPPVRYDPTKPEVSTLEVGQVSGCRLIFAGSIGLLLGLGGVVFTIWSALTPAG